MDIHILLCPSSFGTTMYLCIVMYHHKGLSFSSILFWSTRRSLSIVRSLIFLAYSLMLCYIHMQRVGEGVQIRKENAFTFTSIVSNIMALAAFPRITCPLFQRKSMSESYASNQ